VLAACGPRTEQETNGAADEPVTSEATAPDASSSEEEGLLRSLGYINLVPVTGEHEEKSGVTRYDRERAWAGLNLFNSRDESSAQLMDMSGRVVHSWASDEKGATYKRFRSLFPPTVLRTLDGWNHVELLDDGDLLVIGTHHMLLRLDWDSRVEWKLDISAHHDVSVAEDGDIYVLADGIRSAEVRGKRIAFQDNYVVVLSPEGAIERQISLFDAFAGSPWQGQLRRRLSRIEPAVQKTLEKLRAGGSPRAEREKLVLRLYEQATAGEEIDDEGLANLLFHNQPQDIFHANSVQVLERDNPGLWRAGDLLVSILKFDMAVIIDHESGRVIWSWGRGELQMPHHATWLSEGHVLIFDNGFHRGWSRIVKVDPRSRRISWQYKADRPESFFSASRGGCQQLPNGNVLVSETDNGRAFEVTPRGEIVWEYYNEDLRTVKGETTRGGIYRMTRLLAPPHRELSEGFEP
jgi:hypothetical protein